MNRKLEKQKKENLNVKIYDIERALILSQVEIIKKTCNLKEPKICVEKS